MKKLFLLHLFVVAISSTSVFGQLGDMLNQVKNHTQNRVVEKANQSVDKALEDKPQKDNKPSNGGSNNTANTQTSNSETGQPSSPTAEKSTVGAAKANTGDPIKAIKSYAKFDFVPGDKIIFEDNFAGESSDEVPSNWIPHNGRLEITKLNGETVMGFLDGDPNAFPRMKPAVSYLPERFTIEFDFWSVHNAGKSTGEAIGHGNGEGGVQVYFYDDNNSYDAETMGDFANFGYININHTQASFGSFTGKYTTGEADENGYYKDLLDKWVHVSIAVSEKSVKVYMNSQRVLNVPIQKGKALGFSVMGLGTDYEMGFKTFMKNVRIAAGGTDPYKRLTTDAKFIARGINFDVAKATLRPESMGELNRIVKMMQEHPELKFEIGGHTDGDGPDADNLKLSDARAKTVKEQLVGMGIDASKLTTKGYGESKPLVPNDTVDGKANNRRVEFTKL